MNKKVVAFIISLTLIFVFFVCSFSWRHQWGLKFLVNYSSAVTILKNQTSFKNSFSIEDIKTAPSWDFIWNWMTGLAPEYIVKFDIKTKDSQTGYANVSFNNGASFGSYTLSWRVGQQGEDVFGMYSGE